MRININNALRIRLVKAGIFSVVLLSSLFFSFHEVFAAIGVGDTGLNATAANAGLSTTVHVPQYVGTVIRTFLGIIGVVFLILIVYGGMQWMLAQGDEQKITNARNLIFQAIIGLAIVFAAYALTSFIVSSIASQTVN